jgi:hypothetical protein
MYQNNLKTSVSLLISRRNNFVKVQFFFGERKFELSLLWNVANKKRQIKKLTAVFIYL